MIPVAHSERLFAAVPNAQIWVMANCDQHTIGKEVVPEKYNCHAIGYVVQPEEYGQRVIEFFKKSLR
jgi:hypothetical protein